VFRVVFWRATAVLGVVIQNEKLGRRFVGKGLTQLLHDPSAGRMAGDVVVENAPPIVGNDEEAVKDSEGDGRYGEEVHGRDSFAVIAQKAEPIDGRVLDLWMRV
jgi:hypothetical protein